MSFINNATKSSFNFTQYDILPHNMENVTWLYVSNTSCKVVGVPSTEGFSGILNVIIGLNISADGIRIYPSAKVHIQNCQISESDRRTFKWRWKEWRLEAAAHWDVASLYSQGHQWSRWAWRWSMHRYTCECTPTLWSTVNLFRSTHALGFFGATKAWFFWKPRIYFVSGSSWVYTVG